MVMGLEDDIADCAISWISQMLFCALLESVVMSARESAKSLSIFFLVDVWRSEGAGARSDAILSSAGAVD